jgi:hypothetical protein
VIGHGWKILDNDRVETGSRKPGEAAGIIVKGALPLSTADSRDPKGNVAGNEEGVKSVLLEETKGLSPTRVQKSSGKR